MGHGRPEILAELSGEFGEFRLYLEPDPDASSPRDDMSNAGVMVLEMDRYILPKEDDGEVQAALKEYSARTVARWLRIFRGATVVLPVWMYEHGPCVSFGTSGRDYPLDADDWWGVGSLAGLIFDTPETRAECGWESADPDVIEAALKAEVDLYDRWAQGLYVGYVIERKSEVCPRCNRGGEWEHVGSLWGIDDPEYAEREGREQMEGMATQGLDLPPGPEVCPS